MTLGPQIVSSSYGGLLKFLPAGEAGVGAAQIQLSDGKGKVTPLYIAAGSVFVDSEFSASGDIILDGLTSQDYANLVCLDITTGKLFYFATSSILNVISSSHATSASYAPNDNDWTIGATFMTASGQANVYIPGNEQQGLGNWAQGDYSHAEGAFTVANGNYSHTEGRNVSSSGTWSHAEGNETLASGNYSHAEGYISTASGPGSHAEGHTTIASGNGSHAEGNSNLASGDYSHAEGHLSKAIGDHSHTEGLASRATGLWSHAEGQDTWASGKNSHAEGLFTTASGDFSHTEGEKTLALGISSHAEGLFTTASGDFSHAEGHLSISQGDHSHAEGLATQAQGLWSHTEGHNTVATGKFSHAGGYETIASKDSQTVVGQYNNPLTETTNDIFVVGVGGNNVNRNDGLKVKAPFGEVVLQQQELISINNQAGAALYFGEPGGLKSMRILSTDFFGNVGTIVLQSWNGSQYQSSVATGTNVVAVFI